jgi:hypothetical protein
MSRRDRLFSVGTILTTAVVLSLLLLMRPVNEERFVFGVLSGWSLALLTIVPSYLLLASALNADKPNRFFAFWAAGTLGRMVIILLAAGLFATLVDRAPIKSFLLSFFLGYVFLTGLELVLTLRNMPDRRHA